MSCKKTNPALIAGLTLLCMFCAHAFCYMNLSFSGASVLVDVSRGALSQIAEGQFLAPFYWRVRGSLSAPLLVGLLSCLYLAATAMLVARLLGLAHPLSLFALCGTLTLHVSVSAINASALHVADAILLALLLAAAGVFLCTRFRFGLVPGALCFFGVLGLQPEMLSAAVALLLLVGIRNADADGRALLRGGVRAALSLALGCALYALGLWLMLNHRGLTLEAALQAPAGAGGAAGLSAVVRAYLEPFRQLLAPMTAYPALCAVLNAALLLLGLAGLSVRMKGLPGSRRAALVLLALLLPFAVNLPAFRAASAEVTRHTYVFCFLLVGAIVGMDSLYAALQPKPGRVLRRAVACTFGTVFLGSVVFSNQVYLKKNLEYQSTLSVMTRVIERAERTEGFEPGYTPVALVGSIEDSALSVTHQGFEHLAAFDAAANNFTTASVDDNTWYFWEIMGYPFNFVSDAERNALAATDAVRRMPAFPAAGCCAMVDGTLVIKLSEAE